MENELISKRQMQQEKVDVFLVAPPINDKTIMNIDISSFCNQRCIYCIYHHIGIHKRGKLIDDSLFRRVTKEAFDLGIREIGLYTTGEVFTNPKLAEYIRYLKNIGFRYVYISTNGILCSPKNFVKVADAGLDSIKFSISAASEEIFKLHHGVTGFQKVLDNLHFVYEYRIQKKLDYKIFVFSIITKKNKSEKNNIKKFFEPLCDELSMQEAINPMGIFDGCEELFDDKFGDGDVFVPQFKCPCPQLFNRIVVNSEGYLCACCYSFTNLTGITDLKVTSLIDAYYSKEFLDIRKRHIEKNLGNRICNRCINGTIETMSSMNETICKKDITYSPIDISEAIKINF